MGNLHEQLTLLAHTSPNRSALLVCDTTGTVTEDISRAALLARVEALASYLCREGLSAGNRIALELNDNVDVLAATWAAWSMGVVTVPLDMKRDTQELREFKVRVSGAKCTLQNLDRSLHLEHVAWMPDLSHEALVLFTSGTTAHPKGAQLTLDNLVTNAEGIVDWLHITENDRFLVQLPLHHINSTTFCLASLLAGASIVMPPRYSNSHFWAQAANSGATITSVVPSIVFDQLAREKEFVAVKGRLKLTRIQLGSAPVVAGDALEFIKKFSIPLYQGYGQTETALRVTGVPMNLPRDAYNELVAENSIGTPMSWAQAEIANAEGHILGEKEEGELVVKGPAVMKGYLGGEPAFRDGYFLTGDIGYWKKIGGRRFFFLIGRSKEIIIKGGVNISPVAVENALKKVSADIDQVYVIGINDERYGEEVGAVVVWKEGVESAGAMRRLKLSLLTGHGALRAYEAPKYLVAIHAEDLPLTSTGKVQRIILKKNMGNALEPCNEIMRSADYTFDIIRPQSGLAEASRALYNHCWQPLIKNADEYKKYLGDCITLGAIDTEGVIAGQISFSYTDNRVTCVSICSAAFKPKPVPVVTETPNAEFVRKYLLSGHDPVMNFHQKLGAELVEVTAGGRSEDVSSLGYTMLLRYPPITTKNLGGPVSNQLIQIVRILADDVGADVYAVSRPGGLASYIH